jgi:hypothetical protein
MAWAPTRSPPPPAAAWARQFTGSEGLDEACVPFFGTFGAGWDDAMVARWSAQPLGMWDQRRPARRRFRPPDSLFALTSTVMRSSLRPLGTQRMEQSAGAASGDRPSRVPTRLKRVVFPQSRSCWRRHISWLLEVLRCRSGAAENWEPVRSRCCRHNGVGASSAVQVPLRALDIPGR